MRETKRASSTVQNQASLSSTVFPVWDRSSSPLSQHLAVSLRAGRRHSTINSADELSRTASFRIPTLRFTNVNLLFVVHDSHEKERLLSSASALVGFKYFSTFFTIHRRKRKKEEEEEGGDREKQWEKRRREKEMHVSIPGRRGEQTRGQTLSLTSCGHESSVALR